jgi:putative addiction module component (TIGR02574 family)
MIDQALKAKVVSLSQADRLELIGALWDSLSHHELPVTELEKALLDARIADAEAHPEDESPWPEAKARLERRLRR